MCSRRKSSDVPRYCECSVFVLYPAHYIIASSTALKKDFEYGALTDYFKSGYGPLL